MKAGEDPAKERSARGRAASVRQQGQIYRCFLVRCRLVPGASPAAGDSAGPVPGWRFMVEEAGRGAERRSFACLEDFEAYLEAELVSSATHGATGRLP
jgi:hypothetical protein